MRVDIMTLFPEMVMNGLETSKMCIRDSYNEV